MDIRRQTISYFWEYVCASRPTLGSKSSFWPWKRSWTKLEKVPKHRDNDSNISSNNLRHRTVNTCATHLSYYISIISTTYVASSPPRPSRMITIHQHRTDQSECRGANRWQLGGNNDTAKQKPIWTAKDKTNPNLLWEIRLSILKMNREKHKN